MREGGGGRDGPGLGNPDELVPRLARDGSLSSLHAIGMAGPSQPNLTVTSAPPIPSVSGTFINPFWKRDLFMPVHWGVWGPGCRVRWEHLNGPQVSSCTGTQGP
jgi:hypothetical protein